jgi:leucine dehydrogenase
LIDFARNASFDGHEQVVFVADEATGLGAIIAVHSTSLGPASGGCRAATYVSADAALTDALRLSRGMSYKNAMANLPSGGGKSVIYKVGPGASRAAVFEAFGEAVEKLGGRYVTAEDVGTSVADMEVVARRTRYVAGLPHRSGLAGGDPSPWTALGVFVALKAALGRPLGGARIAVQGLGSVGYKLCERLHAEGAKLVVADINPDRVNEAVRAFGAEVSPVDRIHMAAADVFSPNAMGAVLNIDTIPDLGAPVVCGGANNQLASREDGERLFARDVVYAPDYVANAGGIINVMAEYNQEPHDSVQDRVLRIGERIDAILSQARAERRPADQIADDLARARIAGGARSVA